MRPSLVGKWQSPDSVVQINADGTLTINGTLYRYTVQGSAFTLIGFDGAVTMPFELDGDRLALTIKGSASAYAPGAYGSTASQSRDAGTWTLDGTTLKVVWQTQGPGSYALVKRNHPKNNDPMLCLDGRCFVTYGPKPPWR